MKKRAMNDNTPCNSCPHKDAEIEQLRQLIEELRHRLDIQAAMAEIHRNYVDAALHNIDAKQHGETPILFDEVTE